MKVLWKLSRHTYYEQLCAAAAVGDLTAPDREKLNRHLESCAHCREVHREYMDINAALLPETSDYEETISGLEASTQTAVLERVAACRRQETAPFRGSAPAKGDSQTRVPSSALGLRNARAWSAALVIVAVICFVLGTRYESLRFNGRDRRAVSSSGLQISKLHNSSDPTSQQVASLQAQLGEATRIVAQLRDDLHLERQRDALLQQTLADRDKQLLTARAESTSLRDQIAAHEQELARNRAALVSKTAELEQVEASADSNQATLIELRHRVQELTEKTNLEATDLQRERDLLSKGREIRDIIGARNLHIVDVYDADAKGHTKRPFARAFYTEGKSLVFYAYDLPGKHGDAHDAQLSYVAWGQKNGKKSSIKNLGILVNDDQGQRRWSLNFSDPHVLAEIDSVFITLEPAGDAGQPSGKRMLTAYLNDAVNHP